MVRMDSRKDSVAAAPGTTAAKLRFLSGSEGQTWQRGQTDRQQRGDF
jgi:hypothetical protein